MLRQKFYVWDTMGGMLHAYTVSRDVVLFRRFYELLQRYLDVLSAEENSSVSKTG